MNLDLSPESTLLAEEARRFLADRGGLQLTRRGLEGDGAGGVALWREMCGMGWAGAALPEAEGGVGMGYEALCVLALEQGRALSCTPFSTSVYLAAEAIAALGTPGQRARWLPGLLQGRVITLAVAQGPGQPGGEATATVSPAGRLTGSMWPVPDGLDAEAALVLARGGDTGVGLYHVELEDPSVMRAALDAIDPSRPQARLNFSDARAERLGGGASQPPLQGVFDRAAVLYAYEQIGGAEACLAMAKDYVTQRRAFGRVIGSFQAIKHKLAEVHVAIELARSNAWYASWILESGGADLPAAAAAARLAASDAFELAARENIQVHGAMGFSWETDCHLYYRRARHLALCIGGRRHWVNRLIDNLPRAATA